MNMNEMTLNNLLMELEDLRIDVDGNCAYCDPTGALRRELERANEMLDDCKAAVKAFAKGDQAYSRKEHALGYLNAALDDAIARDDAQEQLRITRAIRAYMTDTKQPLCVLPPVSEAPVMHRYDEIWKEYTSEDEAYTGGDKLKKWIEEHVKR